MSDKYVVPVLRGKRVLLEPLALEHCDVLAASATEDRLTYSFTRVPQGIAAMTQYVEELLQDFEIGNVVPFVQKDAVTNRVVGMTRFMTLRSPSEGLAPYAVEIGGTWLAPFAQRTGINTEAKFLLLRFAFEEWGVARVELKTDERNELSKAAIARIGATFEGVLRKFQPSLVSGEETLYRNTAMFSITDEEWPGVKTHLTSLIR